LGGVAIVGGGSGFGSARATRLGLGCGFGGVVIAGGGSGFGSARATRLGLGCGFGGVAIVGGGSCFTGGCGLTIRPALSVQVPSLVQLTG
jgi:hypothetical protein